MKNEVCTYCGSIRESRDRGDECPLEHGRCAKDTDEIERLRARLAEAERLLRDCYSPVRRIAEGGSRTREDLERAEDTFARLKEFLS